MAMNTNIIKNDDIATRNFANLPGLKLYMNSQVKSSQIKSSQAKPQCSASREEICLKHPSGSWSLHKVFVDKAETNKQANFSTKTLN